MGNHAKKVKLAAQLKAQGLGRLYATGWKRVARRQLGPYNMRNLAWKLQFKPGDLVNDCDGFNHRIVKWLADWGWSGVIDLAQFEREDGYWSCGCPSGPDVPWTREQVESFALLGFTPESIASSKRGGWWNEEAEAKHQALLRGEHIADEQGMKLPWVVALRKKTT